MKKTAVISLTERGRALSAFIKQTTADHEITRFCFRRHTDDDAFSFDDMASLTGELFKDYDVLVFVCAAGIAFRMCAPYLVSKQTDPAVIVIGEQGTHVIPVLSGHIGGANAFAEHIAEKIGAEAVITTATDTGGRFSPDSFAAANDLIITDFDAAKKIAAAVLEGKKIGFKCDHPYGVIPDDLVISDDTEYGIIVGESSVPSPYSTTLYLPLKNIVVGIGCKKGTPAENISEAVSRAFTENGISPVRICKAASIDLKADEAGLLEYCHKTGVPLVTYSSEELIKAEGDFTESEFVRSVTGTGNVCERSAVLCSGGKLVIRKTAFNGVTVAAAEMPVRIDFSKKVI
ncbi:cobalt-precorrin 5A hydrolase [Ruminococcus sp. HUN007]|uniref:cobalt-precorrin 5A hydrolase n=1 Tax=Ruminococcus sp. HUN007 TaxID=1514668 RepID=UPI0005D146C6|nr:cobalt-precorrin 5A hydrolase [Ruminococcus sp. HUN007]